MTPPPPRPRARHRLRRALLWLAGALAVYALAVGLALPVVVLPRLESTMSAALGRKVSIQRLRIDPFALSVTVNGLEADDADGSPFLRCQALYANLQISSLLRRAIVLREVRLSKPYLHLIIDRARNLNLAGLPVIERARSTEGAGLPPLLAGLIEIDGGEVLFTDHSRPTPFQEEFAPIHVALQHFSTFSDRAAPYAFRATSTDGDSFEWEGMLSMQPFRSEGRFHAVGTLPETVWRYLRDALDFQVGNASLEISAHYALQRSDGGLSLSLDGGELRLRNFALTERRSQDVVLTIPGADVDGATFDLASRRATIASLRSRGGTIRLVRRGGGAFGLRQSAAGRPRGAAAPAPPAGPQAPGRRGPGLEVRLEKLDIADCRVDLEDRTTSPPTSLQARNVSLRGEDLSSRPGAAEKLHLAFDLASGGRLEGDGTVTFDPLGADAAISVDGLDLRALQPYLAEIAKLDIARGSATLNGRVALVAPGAARASEPRLRFRGRGAVSDLHLTRAEGGGELIGWSSLALDGASLALAPSSLSVKDVVWQDPMLHLHRRADGGLDTSWWIGPRTGKDAASGGASVRDAGFPLSIASAKVQDGSASTEDDSVQPPVRQVLRHIQAAIEGLATSGKSPFQLRLEGELNGEAAVAIDGTVGAPLNGAPTRIELKASNYGMTTLSPYAARYLGHGIDRGKLSVKAKYRLTGSELDSDNHLVMDQLALGKQVESPQAISLRLGLAMALLRNRRGQIAMDFSVHGDLGAPGFSYRAALGHALVNVITKIAGSPFEVLGSLVGGGAELGYVVFAPDSDALEPDQAGKVDALAKALEDRPALRIEVRGTASANLDTGNESDLRRLARRRAGAVRDELVAKEGIAPTRVFLLGPALQPAPAGATHVRTELSLTAD